MRRYDPRPGRQKSPELEAARVGPIDRLVGSGEAEDLQRAGLVVRRRLAYLYARTGNLGPERTHPFVWVLIAGLILWGLWQAVQTDWWMIFVAGFGVFYVLIFTVSIQRHNGRLRNLIRTRCPECGYHLDALSERPLADTAFVEVGPRTCPECGVAWPLVPPAAPGESNPDHASPTDGADPPSANR